jgi:VWFA-related protein
LLLAGLGSVGARGAEEPKPSTLKESVQVNLVPLEVTVWPTKGDSDACLGLTIDDFELTVDGKPQKLYAVDSLGATQEVYAQKGSPAEGPSPGGLSVVLFFDLWHLDVFYRGFPACPSTKPLAFNEARRYVRDEFHDGDRLLLVTAAGWPVVHDGWLRTRADALAALDRLETDRQVKMPRQEHLHHNGWIAGIESLFLALGRYPGRKDVIYLADDFRFDDVALRMYDIAARAQANGVVVSAVDLLSSCRRVVGQPCMDIASGLGCTMFREPVALNPMSRDTGGTLFGTERIDSAVQQLRSMRKCRYLVSFRQGPRTTKRAPSIELSLRSGLQKDLTLFAPSSYESAANAPSRKDDDDALFLLPRFGSGLAADVVLWPYRPEGKHGRWNVFVLARVDRTDNQPWPDELTELTIRVIVHARSKGYGQYTRRLGGEPLKAFVSKGGTGSMLFPMEGIHPGDATVDLTVTGNAEDISANVSRTFTVPKPPSPGEARPWFLADHYDRVGERAVLAPSFDGVVSADEFVSFIGYGCLPKGGPAATYTGRLTPREGGATLPFQVAWLTKTDGSSAACGWLAGKLETPLTPGHWRFTPPADLAGGDAGAGVDFDVAPDETKP